MKLGIPAYIYPSSISSWQPYISTASNNEFIIANDANGDFTAADSNYVAVINAAKAAGNRVLGYVHTTWAARPIATVQARIDAWVATYNIDGIFFDEVSTDCGDKSYYQTAVSYAQSKGLTYTVLNPGMSTPSCYDGVANAICTFENTEAAYASHTPLPWEATATSKIWHIVHTSSSCASNNFSALVSTATSKGADILWLGSDFASMPACWSALSSSLNPATTSLSVTSTLESHTVATMTATVQTVTVRNLTFAPVSGVTISSPTPSNTEVGSWSGPVSGITIAGGSSYTVTRFVSPRQPGAFVFNASAAVGTYSVSTSVTLTAINVGVCDASVHDWAGRPCCGSGSGDYQKIPAFAAASGNLFQGSLPEGVYPNSYSEGPGTQIPAASFRGLVIGASGCFNAGWLLNDVVVSYVDRNNIPHTNVNIFHQCSYPTCTGGFICGPLAIGSYLPSDAMIVTAWTATSQFTFGPGGGSIVTYYTMPASNAVAGPHNGVDVSCNAVSTDVDVVLTKTAFSASVKPGQTAIYDVKVTNTGPAAANNVLVTDLIPADASSRTWLIEPSSNGSYSGGTSGSGSLNGTVNLPPNGGFVWFVVSDVVSTSTSAANIGSTVSVTLPNGMHDINGANNIPVNVSVPIDYTVAPIVPTLTNRCTANYVDPNGPISFVLTVENPSSSSVSAFLTNFRPPTISSWSWTASLVSGVVTGFTASGTGSISDHLVLNPNSKLVYTINGTVAGSGLGHSLQNDAQAVWTINGVQSATIASGVAAVRLPEDLQGSPLVTKTADSPTAAPGDVITWTLRVQNNNSFTIGNIRIQDSIPVGLSAWSYTAVGTSGAGGFTPTGTTGINETLTLPAGATVTYTIRGTVLTSGFPNQIVNSVTYTNSEGYAHTPVTSAVSIGGTVCFDMTQTANKSVVTAGDTVTYTLVIKNKINYSIPRVNVLSGIPAGVASRTFTTSATGVTGAPLFSSGAINNMVHFAPFGEITYTIVDTVAVDRTGPVSSTAALEFDEGYVAN